MAKKKGKKKFTAPLFGVILMNDDVNSYEHVVQTLQKTFRIEEKEAKTAAKIAHDHGGVCCGLSYLEHAEMYLERLGKGGLQAKIVPEEELKLTDWKDEEEE